MVRDRQGDLALQMLGTPVNLPASNGVMRAGGTLSARLKKVLAMPDLDPDPTHSKALMRPPESRETPNWMRGIYAGLCLYLFLRSEEHTSELQSRGQLVCRLLLE